MIYAINMLAKPRSVTVSQMTQRNVSSAMGVYIQNAIVCLGSVMAHNPDIKPMICVDFDLPEDYLAVLAELGIVVEKVEFRLEVATESNWSICNYRYCVMGYLCEKLQDDDIVMMLDTDIICVDSLKDLVEDVHEDIMLYDVCHTRENRDRQVILKNYERIYQESGNLIHYGGEFICSRVRNLKKLHQSCLRIIEDSNAFADLLNFNDEHITSMAVFRDLRHKAHNSAAYLFRYWTGTFYLASTNWKSNPVALWHLPVEKQTGICKVYRYFRRYGCFPDRTKLARLFGLPKAKRPDWIRYYCAKIIRGVKKRLKR